MRITVLSLLISLLLPLTVIAALVEVPQTGQTTSFVSGDDGDLEAGAAWPSPRFSASGDGTVTDNLTGLIWLQNANCYGIQTWYAALSSVNTLASGSCGLSDGSAAGDWRLPNITELESLVDIKHHSPAIPAVHPFSAVQSDYYCSSSTDAAHTSLAWIVSMDEGLVGYSDKNSIAYYVWPVRGAQ